VHLRARLLAVRRLPTAQLAACIFGRGCWRCGVLRRRSWRRASSGAAAGVQLLAARFNVALLQRAVFKCCRRVASSVLRSERIIIFKLSWRCGWRRCD
jgi:hypothetical protein